MTFSSTSLAETLPLIGSVAVMRDGGAYSDILPIYFYCFLLLYGLFWMVPRIGLGTVLAISGLIYAASQATYAAGMFGYGNRFIVFDVPAWQFLLMAFLYIGTRSQDAAELIKRLPQGTFYALMAVAAVVVLVGRQTSYFPTPFEGFAELNSNWPRVQLHPVYLFKILAFISLFCAILLRPEGPLAWLDRVMRWYFSLPFLVNAGKYSIQMFTLHVFMMAGFQQAAPSLSAPGRYALAASLVLLFIVVPGAWVTAKRDMRLRQSPAPAESAAPSRPTSPGEV
ncbi:hypothetical protein ACFB49_17760 [Sphingomonas sp. DBB INV C78]|uniref:OpgC domain-containing protein n=1 Tax=Sphingomonas sp. DBB INV C78 TaxID=3349434 RepID=UPI0036D2C571